LGGYEHGQRLGILEMLLDLESALTKLVGIDADNFASMTNWRELYAGQSPIHPAKPGEIVKFKWRDFLLLRHKSSTPQALRLRRDLDAKALNSIAGQCCSKVRQGPRLLAVLVAIMEHCWRLSHLPCVPVDFRLLHGSAEKCKLGLGGT
jgi:hypothetical protein